LHPQGSFQPKSLSILPSLYDDQPNPKIPHPIDHSTLWATQNYKKTKYTPQPKPPNPQPKPPNPPLKPLKQPQMEENDLDCPQNLFQDSQHIDNFYNPGYKKKKYSKQPVNTIKKSEVMGKSALPSKRTIPNEKLNKKKMINYREKENLGEKSVGAEGLTLPSFAARKKSVKPKKKAGQITGKDGVMVRGEAS
jgi:hypothetical protein